MLGMTEIDRERLFDISFVPDVMKDGKIGYDTCVTWGNDHKEGHSPDRIPAEDLLVRIQALGCSADEAAHLEPKIRAGKPCNARLTSSLRKMVNARFIYPIEHHA
jgi:hypothetical protein